MTGAEAIRERLLGPRPSAREIRWAWWGPLIAMVLGGVARFWALGHPRELVFDETYYVKQGWSLVLFGVEREVKEAIEEPDPLFRDGQASSIWDSTGDLVVHPPVGKWIIGSGQWLLGEGSTVGWRLGVAVLGTLSILMLGRIAWRLWHNATLATLASTLLALEGHHLVHSRTGLLDIIVMFFALAAFAALLIDRERSRDLLARKVAAAQEAGLRAVSPWLGVRPWRWVAGIMLGLTIGTKWSGLYFLAVFGLMTVWWDLGARRAVGVRHWFRDGVAKDGLFAFVAMVPTALVVYVISWAGWFASDEGYKRHWADDNPGTGLLGMLPGPLRSLIDYHREVLTFHVGLSSPHDYEANPWSWLVMGRPTSFYYRGLDEGEGGCTIASCSRAITNIGTVSIWWVAAAGILVLVAAWLFRRDWRAGAILSGIAAGWLPWLLYQERTIFTFYSIAFTPWIVLVVVYLCAMVLGPVAASARRRRIGVAVVGAYTLVVFATFWFWYPIWTAQLVPYSFWHLHMWFPSWI